MPSTSHKRAKLNEPHAEQRWTERPRERESVKGGRERERGRDGVQQRKSQRQAAVVMLLTFPPASGRIPGAATVSTGFLEGRVPASPLRSEGEGRTFSQESACRSCVPSAESPAVRLGRPVGVCEG